MPLTERDGERFVKGAAVGLVKLYLVAALVLFVFLGLPLGVVALVTHVQEAQKEPPPPPIDAPQDRNFTGPTRLK